MPELIIGALPLLIPVLALSIGLVVVVGGVIVQPLTKALVRLADAQSVPRTEPTGQRVTELENRVASLERTLEQVLEEQYFQRELQSGPTPAKKEAQPVSREIGPRPRA